MIRTAKRPRTGRTTYHHDGTTTIWDSIDGRWVRGSDENILGLHPGTCWLGSGEFERLERRIAKRAERSADREATR